MATRPFISICIPAYKRADLLKKLLDSISMQTFRDFEVIVTDDSPDGSVQALCRQYEDVLPLLYCQNTSPLGTPENWNEAIRKSGGKWIKLMHDDDWFAGAESLGTFAGIALAHREASFIFSAYRNIYPDGRKKNIAIGASRYRRLRNDPTILLAGNLIGPPSCVMFERGEGLFFEKRFKWLVDIDFYIQYLISAHPVYTPEVLINIGIGDTQVTKSTFGNRAVEIPENFLLLERVGTGSLRKLRVFDTWWRLIRNLRIRELKEIRDAGFTGQVPRPISAIIRFQQKFSYQLLKIGPVSKGLMWACFIFTGAGKNTD